MCYTTSYIHVGDSALTTVKRHLEEIAQDIADAEGNQAERLHDTKQVLMERIALAEKKCDLLAAIMYVSLQEPISESNDPVKKNARGLLARHFEGMHHLDPPSHH